MGRPTKQGIDYFPIDVQFDGKVEMYIIETESEGLGVLITIWQLIYQNEGYFIKNDEDLLLMIKKRVSVDINKVSEFINKMLIRNIFDKGLYEKYGILTSRGIQKRYFDAAKRKKEIQVESKYLLYDVSAYENLIIVDNNSNNVSGNAAKEKEEEEVKEEVKEYIYIFDFWNEKNIIQHRKLTDKIKRKINGSLKDYSQEEILTAISNYDYILNSKEYYWTHKWTLVEFLQRGLEKFMDLETAKNNYLKNNNGFTDKKEYQKTSGDDFNVIQ